MSKPKKKKKSKTNTINSLSLSINALKRAGLINSKDIEDPRKYRK